MNRILRQYWFFVFLGVIVTLWIFTAVAYATGAAGVKVETRTSEATIDFMRDTEFPVLKLKDDLGVELTTFNVEISGGTIVKLRKASFPLCLICGEMETAGRLGSVTYRKGDWYFRAPDATADFVKRFGQTPPREKVEEIGTVAFNAKSGERIVLPLEATENEQLAALTDKGLTPDHSFKLSPETIGDVQFASMLGEGCVIFNVAFVFVALLYLLVAGPIWLIRRRRGRGRITVLCQP
jgi:hypothetical protein